MAGRQLTRFGPAQSPPAETPDPAEQRRQRVDAEQRAAELHRQAEADQREAVQRQQAEAKQREADLRREAEAARRASATEVRVALVIGNGAYINAGALHNPINDARAVAAALRQIGFDVVEGVDLNRLALEQKIKDFLHRALRAKVTLLFYSGHGMQVDGKNYLIPVDAKLLEPTDLRFETFELDRLFGDLSDPGRTNLIFLDACRDNPLARSFSRSLPLTRSAGVPAGLAAYATNGTGTLVAYATAPGQTALDGQGANSPFTTALLKQILVPRLEIRTLLTRVRLEVASATNNKRIPWENSSLMGEVYLVK